MKGPHVGLDAKDLAATRIEENDRRHVAEVERARPFRHFLLLAPRTRCKDCTEVARDEAHHVEFADLGEHFRALEAFALQLVAARAGRRLEQHRERLGAELAAQVLRLRHEKGLIREARGCRGFLARRGIVQKGHFALHAARHEIERRLESFRRVVAVDAQHDPAALVEEDDGWRELDLHHRRELLLAHLAAIEPGA